RNSAGILDVWQGISGQYDGKSASRLRAKPSGGLYAVFPYILIEETEKRRPVNSRLFLTGRRTGIQGNHRRVSRFFQNYLLFRF
ncbi:MAG: hypothetical protein ACLTXT_07640, partial [Ruminococcus callidus]